MLLAMKLFGRLFFFFFSRSACNAYRLIHEPGLNVPELFALLVSKSHVSLSVGV